MIRAMRLIVMFDLPSVTKREMVQYQKWHKFLVRNGFIMMTESVYSRLLINKSVSSATRVLIQKNSPTTGIVQLLEITERQYSMIEYLVGNAQTKTIDTAERYIEL